MKLVRLTLNKIECHDLFTFLSIVYFYFPCQSLSFPTDSHSAECRSDQSWGTSETPLPGKSCWRGRLSTIDLLALTSLDHSFFIFKMLFFYFYKTTYLKKEVNGTEPSPLISFPCRCLKIVAYRNHRDRKKQSYYRLYCKNRFEPILTGQHFLFLFLRQCIEWKETEHSRFLSNSAEKSFIVFTTVLRQSPSGGYSQSFFRSYRKGYFDIYRSHITTNILEC